VLIMVCIIQFYLLGAVGMNRQYTIERIAEAQSRQTRAGRVALWVAAVSLAAIALTLVL